MALIECPECGNQVSDKASACPHCGCPISISNSSQIECPNCGMAIDSSCEECPICGYLLKQTVGVYQHSTTIVHEEERREIVKENPYEPHNVNGVEKSDLNIRGDVKIWAYSDGIKIGDTKSQSIHRSQIQNVRFDRLTEKEDIQQDKSVIKRAVVGGLLAGPVGAVVGGMSGLGTKHTTEIIHKYRLCINYIDEPTGAPKELVVLCDILSPVREFAIYYSSK